MKSISVVKERERIRRAIGESTVGRPRGNKTGLVPRNTPSEGHPESGPRLYRPVERGQERARRTTPGGL